MVFNLDLVVKINLKLWIGHGEWILVDFEKILANMRWFRQWMEFLTNTGYSKGGVLFTSTRYVIRQWKEYFQDLLNAINTSSREEIEFVGLPLTGAMVVKKLHRGRTMSILAQPLLICYCPFLMTMSHILFFGKIIHILKNQSESLLSIDNSESNKSS